MSAAAPDPKRVWAVGAHATFARALCAVRADASASAAQPLLDLGGVLNMKPGFEAPPSASGLASWQAIIEVGGSQQFVTEGRFYSSHSLLGVRAPEPCWRRAAGQGTHTDWKPIATGGARADDCV